MRMLIVPIMLFFVGCNRAKDANLPQGPVPDSRGFRIIAISTVDAGYHTNESKVLHTREEYEAYLKKIDTQAGWNDRAGFRQAIDTPGIDFAHEALVLIRYTDFAAAPVEFAIPHWRDDRLVCTIYRELAVAEVYLERHYCFALAVDKKRAKQIEIWVTEKPSGPPREVLPVNGG